MTKESYFGKWVDYMDMNEMMKVLSILEKEYRVKSVFPKYKDIFKAFHLCPLDTLKAVFLLQDPYPDKFLNKPRATGIALANDNSIANSDISPSLKIIKESIINFEKPHKTIIFANELEEWSKQGILLLNSALTVEANKAGSHTMLWRPFIASLLKNLSDNRSGLLYVLFGSQAQTFEPYINKITSNIMKFRHPAYYARTHSKMPYSVFIDINNKIEALTGTKIEWFKELKYE